MLRWCGEKEARSLSTEGVQFFLCGMKALVQEVKLADSLMRLCVQVRFLSFGVRGWHWLDVSDGRGLAECVF